LTIADRDSKIEDMKTRRVILSVECDTVLTHSELLELRSLVFGQIRRKDMNDRAARWTIKRTMPKWVGHDVRGTIQQVQVNVMKAGKRSPATKATKRPTKAGSARSRRATKSRR
jgi:hypothetical protein